MLLIHLSLTYSMKGELNSLWTTLSLTHPNKFTQISSFGLNTICYFPPDVADMSQWPAWLFEQVLQVRPVRWFTLLKLHSTSHTAVLHPHVWSSLPSCTRLEHSTAPIPAMWMASIGQASNVHRRFACTAAEVHACSWWSASPSSMWHLCNIYHPWITQGSCATAEEVNGWPHCRSSKERSLLSLASENTQSWHIQDPCPW